MEGVAGKMECLVLEELWLGGLQSAADINVFHSSIKALKFKIEASNGSKEKKY